jgi:hypothetical protein
VCLFVLIIYCVHVFLQRFFMEYWKYFVQVRDNGIELLNDILSTPMLSQIWVRRVFFMHYYMQI